MTEVVKKKEFKENAGVLQAIFVDLSSASTGYGKMLLIRVIAEVLEHGKITKSTG